MLNNPATDFVLGRYGVSPWGAREEPSYALISDVGDFHENDGVALAGASLEPISSSSRKETCIVPEIAATPTIVELFVCNPTATYGSPSPMPSPSEE